MKFPTTLDLVPAPPTASSPISSLSGDLGVGLPLIPRSPYNELDTRAKRRFTFDPSCIRGTDAPDFMVRCVLLFIYGGVSWVHFFSCCFFLLEIKIIIKGKEPDQFIQFYSKGTLPNCFRTMRMEKKSALLFDDITLVEKDLYN